MKLMYKELLSVLLGFILLSTSVWASSSLDDNDYLHNKTQILSQQTELLKNRLLEAQRELNNLSANNVDVSQIPQDQLDKDFRTKAKLNVALAKSNLDSINVEFEESQQTVTRLEKDIQEITNQLNVYSIFGVNIARSGSLNLSNLKLALENQQNLLALEKERVSYLQQLQKIALSSLQVYTSRFSTADRILKSHSLLQLRDEQTNFETKFQKEQSQRLVELNSLYQKLADTHLDPTNRTALLNEVFFNKENLNLIYLKMLIVRYQDQLEQLQSLSLHSTSINFLNQATEHVQVLSSQLLKVRQLLTSRMTILKELKDFPPQPSGQNEKSYLADLDKITNEYEATLNSLSSLDREFSSFRVSLDQALQFELSSRQGLPGFSAKAWLDLGQEAMLIPSLTFQIGKSLGYEFFKGVAAVGKITLFFIFLAQIAWIMLFTLLSHALTGVIGRTTEHEFGHLNPKRLVAQIIKNNLVLFAIITNVYLLFLILQIPTQNSAFLINIAWVGLIFKALIDLAKLSLLETIHHGSGHDVRLYHRLKWILIVGGVITALTVFMNQLPLIYEVKDLFNRLFLSFLLIVSIFLLKSWEVVPGLILPHIDDRRPYIKKIIRLLGLLIPLIMLINSAIGLFGFVNLVLTVSWYEGLFLLVLVGYLVVRGILIDAMVYFSTLLIKHVNNGWLWTEAFLKPIDKVIRVTLFFTAWGVLFLLYGWDERSPVVERINKLLNLHLVDILNTSITPWNIIEVTIILSFLYWAAKWTREFVYRFLLSKTTDLGLRNSIAIFSQYMMVVIGIFICLRVLGIDFRALTVVAGAFAFGIGLGLRDLANNFVCGFLLLIERPLRVGDTISIAGYEGEVTNIGARAVAIKNWDHMEVLVPNAEIFSKSFINWTARDQIVRSSFNIKINRHDNPHFIKSLIHEAVSLQKDILNDPPAEVLLKELNDSLIDFEVRYYVNLKVIKSRVGVRSQALMAIWETFEKHHIKPPYPQHEIHFADNNKLAIEDLHTSILKKDSI